MAAPPDARSPGPSVRDLLAADTRTVPAALADAGQPDSGTAEVPKSRYTSPEFAELENRYLWTRTWQMACMEVDLAAAGDHVVYDVADQSVIVTRTAGGDIKAFHNACLHRGTKLRAQSGRVASFRCPFHGWRWSLDGELVEQPCDWDFPQTADGTVSSCLPEVSIATWQGFVFVNLDPGAEPFESYASTLIEHFDHSFGFDRRYRGFHTVKEVPANWKVCMEAFSEAYHVIATHPQILEFCADANSEYSSWADAPHVSRFINAFGAQSPHLDALGQQRVADAYAGFFTGLDPGSVDVGHGAARPVVAEVLRSAIASRFDVDLSTTTDCEILDAILYHLFPAFAPWAGVGQPLVYRWRPGPTPDTCFMDVLRLAPVPDAGPVPEAAPMSVLALDQPWSDAPGMGGLAPVLEQDMANLPLVQAGLKSRGKPTVTFSSYQEGRLRRWHRLIDTHIEAGLRADGRPTECLDPHRVIAS